MNAASQALENGSDLVDEIIRLADFHFDRLPMLEIVGERFADTLAVAVQDLTGHICQATMSELDYLPFGQAMAVYPAPALMAVSSAPALEGDILLVLDAPLVLTVMDMAMGGTVQDVGADVSGFTAIERGFASQIAEVTLKELSAAFSMVAEMPMECERVESEAESAAVAQMTSLCVRMRIALHIGDHDGTMQVIIPYDALEPVSARLKKMHLGDRVEFSGSWRPTLQSHIESAALHLEAVFGEVTLPIQSIIGWNNGDIISLWVDEDHEATVYHGETALFRAVTGKRNNGKSAIRITQMLESEEETENGCNDR